MPTLLDRMDSVLVRIYLSGMLALVGLEQPGCYGPLWGLPPSVSPNAVVSLVQLILSSGKRNFSAALVQPTF